MASFPIKQLGLSIHNSVKTSTTYYYDSTALTKHLVQSLHDITAFSLPDHLALRKEIRLNIYRQCEAFYEGALDGLLSPLPSLTRQVLQRGTDTGQ